MINAQQWLQEKFPTQESREKVKVLIITGAIPQSSFISQSFRDSTGRTVMINGGIIFRSAVGSDLVNEPVSDEREKIRILAEFKKSRQKIEIDESRGHFEWVGIDSWEQESSLEIKNFPNLEQLIITEQPITGLKVSGTTKLKKLTCAYNGKLKSLDLSCPALEGLQINNNYYLENANLGTLPQIVKFYHEWTGRGRQVIDEFNTLENQLKERQRTDNSVNNDMGWLTDDNIEYILKNNQAIQTALNRQNQNNRNWQIRTDIANIHNYFERARTNQELDLANLLQELTINPSRYTIFPLRVNGNHWGLFILEEFGDSYRVYYTSSLKPETEVNQIKLLITKLVNQNAANNIQVIQGAKQNNGYDCGVHLIKYIQEFLETGNLSLNRSITEQDCQEFRREWKEKIGEIKWCIGSMYTETDIKGDQSQQSTTSRENSVGSIKNILLTGRTGSGKSTLGNVLVNEFKENEPFKEVFKESSASVSETKNVKVQELTVNLREDGSEKVCYLVIDTAGFGDTQLTTKEVLQLLQELVKFIGNEGINQLFFVNSGRFTKEEIDIYRLLESVLFDQEVAKYTTIIRTRFPEFENEEACEADRQSLQGENNELFNMIGSVRIVYVDNPPLVGRPELVKLNREIRQESNKRLITYLGKCQETYKPANLATLQQRIDDYQTKTEQLQKELQEKEQSRQQRETQLQQQISSLRTQQQNEISRVQRNFNSRLNAAYQEQQRQINEVNERHQRELAQLRRGETRTITEKYACLQGHTDIYFDVGWDCFDPNSNSEEYYCPSCGSYGTECLTRTYTLEEQSQAHSEAVRRLQQQIQDQENRNQEEISRISQQMSQRQSFINSQRWSEENGINQRYQQTENNLRSEISRQAQEQEDERRRYDQELSRLRSGFEQHIEQKTLSNFPWRR